jgi:hypothetical protein
MRSFRPDGKSDFGGKQVVVNVGGINITQPNASAAEIADHVANRVAGKMGMQTQRDLVQANGPYQ